MHNLINLGKVSDKFGTTSAFFFSSVCFGIGTCIVLLMTLRRLWQLIKNKYFENAK